MGRQGWSRGDIESFVEGRLVLISDDQVCPLPVPPWMVEAAAAELSMSLAEVLDALHPDDRGPLALWFYDVLGRPGEASTMPARGNLGDGWFHYEIGLLNLTEDPTVGGIVGTGRALGPVEVTDDELGSGFAGRHDSVDWFMARLNREGRIFEIQGKVRELLGVDPEDVLGKPPVSFMHADAIPDVVSLWNELVSTPGATSTSQRCFVRPDGVELWAQSIYLNRLQPDGSGDILLMAYDITDRREQDEALRRSNEENRALAEQFRVLADEVPAAVFRCDAAGAVSFCNTRWHDLVERDGEVTDLVDAVHADDRAALRAALAELGDAPDVQRTRLEVRGSDGERTLSLTLRWAGDPGASTTTGAAIVGSLEDITATVILRHQAERDPLTGLWNRSSIEDVLWEVVDGGAEPDAAVIFIDLDRFKTVNDTFGHEAGDLVLQAVADRLHCALRPEDHIGRFGGDEFLVVCRGVDDMALTRLVRRIEETLFEPVPLTGGSWIPQASIGAVRPRPGEDAASAVRRADLAMFDDKRRNRSVAPTRR